MRIIWPTLAGFTDYQINRLGQIRNANTGRELNPYDDGKGYLRVKLNCKNCRLHILVAKTFCKNLDPLIKTQVNHKRGNKNDCRASQLEWVSPSENIQHAWDTGLRK